MTRYLWPIGFVAAAMAAGAALVPGSWEMAFMKLRDRDFSAAERALEEKFLSGARQREVLLPLSELYVRTGRVDKAIDVLRTYAEAAPSERDVSERLTELLKEAQETDQATAQLARLSKDHPSADKLRELDRLYDIQDNVDARIAVLARLVRLPEATPQEFLTLVNLLAAADRKTDAMTAAFNAIKRWPADAPVALVQTFAALAIDAKRPDLIGTALSDWTRAQTSAPPLAAVVSTLIDKSSADQAILMVSGSAAIRRDDPAAVVLLARLLADRGRKADAFAKLDALRARNRLPADAAPLFAGTALALNKTSIALETLRARGTAVFDDAMLIYAVSQTPATARDWLDWAEQDLSLGPQRPLPGARIALARGDRAAAASRAAAARAALTPSNAMSVAQLFVDLDDIAVAKEIFDATRIDPQTIPLYEVGQAAFVAIAVKDRQRAIALTTRLIAHDASAGANIAHARALALNERFQDALDLLDKAGSADPAAELAKIDVFKAAGKLAELRALLIGRLLSDDLTEPRRTSYIFSLNDLKGDLGRSAARLAPVLTTALKDETLTALAKEARLNLLSRISPLDALPFLKTAAHKDLAKAGYAYAEALKKTKSLSALREFLAYAVQNAKDQKLRDGYLYELIKWGGAETLPLLAQRARAEGEKWFYAYDAALKKYATPQARRDALVSFAQDAGAKPALKKQIAFQILEFGGTSAAEDLFRDLAADAGPESDIVKQLAYIWGPRPKPAAMDWLRARLKLSQGRDRTAWAAIVLNAGDADATIAALKDLDDPASRVILANAYVETKNAGALKKLVADAIDKGVNGPAAGQLAQAAEALSLNTLASRAHELAADANPKSWLAAGRTAFFAGDFSRAQTLLERSAGRSPPAQTWFYLGETLWSQRKLKEAAPKFERALQTLDQSVEERRLRLVALARLKRHAEAQAELAAAANDDEKLDAQSAYAGALLDQGDTSRATDALALAQRP